MIVADAGVSSFRENTAARRRPLCGRRSRIGQGAATGESDRRMPEQRPGQAVTRWQLDAEGQLRKHELEAGWTVSRVLRAMVLSEALQEVLVRRIYDHSRAS